MKPLLRNNFAYLGALALLGCGVEVDDTASVEQEVVGGSNVTNAQNTNTAFPYGSVVRISPPLGGPQAGFPTTSCSAAKIGPNRFLTAAHCTETWNGPFQGRILITNHPTNEAGALDSYTVTQVHAHPSWVIKPTGGAYIGRPYDVAMFDIQETTSSIPALFANNAPKINSRDITDGWISRLVGYGSGRKAWGDNTAVQLTGDNFAQDEAASKWTSFFWAGQPGGEPGDSGAPVLNELTGGWWVSGIVSGQGPTAGQSRMSRAEPLINWINNPAPRSLTGGAGGYLINARAPFCMKQSGNDYVSQWACYEGTSTSDSQFWSLQSTGVANRFRIRNGSSGKCLGAENNLNNGHLRTYTCDTTNTNLSQQWDFVDRGALDQVSGDTASGYRFYQIRNVQGPNKLCLAPFNNTESQGQLMHYYTCTTPPSNPVGNPQVFAFTR